VPAFTVVGTSSVAIAGDGSVAIPVPSGTSVGDLLVVGFWGGAGCEVTDARLTAVNRTGIGSPYNSGAYGVATDLSDVTLTFTGYPRLAIVLALADVAPGFTGEALMQGTVASLVFDESPGVAGIGFVCDIGTGFTPASVGGSADWDTQDHVTLAPELYDLRCFSFDGVSPVPALDVSFDPATISRAGFRLLWPVPATSRPFLRQRQSPRANPRVDLNRPNLRVRQVIP